MKEWFTKMGTIFICQLYLVFVYWHSQRKTFWETWRSHPCRRDLGSKEMKMKLSWSSICNRIISNHSLHWKIKTSFPPPKNTENLFQESCPLFIWIRSNTNLDIYKIPILQLSQLHAKEDVFQQKSYNLKLRCFFPLYEKRLTKQIWTKVKIRINTATIKDELVTL